MKSIYLTFLICCFIQLPAAMAADNYDRLEALDEELKLLLPGTGIQEQSSRIYAKERLQVLFETLEKRNVRRKNTAKAIHIIQEEIEKGFLNKFADFSNLNLLFKQEIYDQSTASAFYALVFNYFGLPFSIEIKASDVKLIADPENLNKEINIPSCKGINNAKYRAFQMAYLELLRTADVLSPSDWDHGPESIFQTYYLGDTEQLSINELASFLHYRQALNAYQQKRWVACLDWIDRAQMIKALPLYGVLKKVVWLQIANESKSGNVSLHYLWKLWDEKPTTNLQSELIHRFNNKVTQTAPISQWKIDSIYGVFKNRFGTNEDAKEQLKATNYLVQARFFAKEGKTVEVMNFMDSLFLMRPDDEEVHQVLAGMLAWSLKSERDFVKGLQRISYYEKQYPFLAKDLLFQDQHLFYKAERIRHHFDADDYVLGELYLAEFEQSLRQTKPTVRHTSWVSTVYISSSNYYFREREYTKALSLIETALIAVPDDSYLQHRKNLLKRYIR